MKKRIVGILVIFTICIVTGCSKQTNNNTIDTSTAIDQSNKIDIKQVKQIGSKIAEDEIYIVSENMNLILYKDFTHIPYISIDCLSSSKISTDKVKVNIDVDTPYTVSVTEVEGEEFDAYSFGLFTGYDWKKARELEKEDEEKYNKYQDNFLKTYNKLSENEIGELHHYMITITFNLKKSKKTETFQDIQVTYNGKQMNKNIGKIVIDCDEKNSKMEKSLYASCLVMSDIYIKKNADGQMNAVNPNMYKAKKAVVVNDISMLNKDTKIENCNVSINSPKGNYDMTWDGEAIEVESDSELGLNILLKRNNFKNKIYYQCNDYLILDYKEGTKNYRTGTELFFATKLTGYQLYAYFLDGIALELEEE